MAYEAGICPVEDSANKFVRSNFRHNSKFRFFNIASFRHKSDYIGKIGFPVDLAAPPVRVYLNCRQKM